MNLTRFALPAILVAMLATAGTAMAAPAWLTPTVISAPNSSNSAPDLAVNAHGDAVAVWSHGPAGARSFAAAVRPAGGAWSAAEDLANDGKDDAKVAIDGNGGALAVWTEPKGAGTVVQASTYTKSGWGAPHSLGVPINWPRNPVVAVDEHGDAVVAWEQDDVGAYVVFAATRAAGGAWSSQKQISSTPDQSADMLDVAIDSHGNSVAVWRRSALSASRIVAATHAAGGPWTADTPVSPANTLGLEPSVAVADDGDVTVAWTEATGPNNPKIIRSAAGSAATGAWNLPKYVSAAGAVDHAGVAVNPRGDALVAWIRQNSGKAYVEASMRSGPGGSWQAPDVLSGPAKGVRADMQAAVDPSGNALVTWSQEVAIGDVPYAASHRVGDPVNWQQPHAVAPPSSADAHPRVEFDATGNAWVALSHGSSIRAAGYDAAPPELSNVQSPASGAAGEALPFSATVSDSLSSATANWDFGDGATATGSPLGHAYAAAGDYKVTVTARDAVGNEATETRTVHVVAPAAPPSPPSPPTPEPQRHVFAGLVLKHQTVAVHRGVARVKASCPADTVGSCAGTLRLLSGSKVIGRARFGVAAGKTARIRVEVSRVVAKGRASARAHDGLGAKRTTSAKLKLRRG